MAFAAFALDTTAFRPTDQQKRAKKHGVCAQANCDAKLGMFSFLTRFLLHRLSPGGSATVGRSKANAQELAIVGK